MYVSVLGRGLGGALGVDEDWPLLSTRPQRYCNPASLVTIFNGVSVIEITRALMMQSDILQILPFTFLYSPGPSPKEATDFPLKRLAKAEAN